VQSVAFSPDSQLLATASSDKTARLWNPATGKQVGQPLTGHTSPAVSVAFSPDGQLLATASGDNTLRLWNPATGEQIGEPLTGHAAVRSLAFSPDGRILATGGGDITRLWRPIWDWQSGCASAVRYVERSQIKQYVPEGWATRCKYPEEATGSK
jgi:WD40 repeat protein